MFWQKIFLEPSQNHKLCYKKQHLNQSIIYYGLTKTCIIHTKDLNALFHFQLEKHLKLNATVVVIKSYFRWSYYHKECEQTVRTAPKRYEKNCKIERCLSHNSSHRVSIHYKLIILISILAHKYLI